jgi:hypothetical protein
MNTHEHNQDDITKLAQAITEEVAQIEKRMIARRSKYGKVAKKLQREETVKQLLNSVSIERI